MLGAESLECAGHRVDVRRVGDADQLSGRAGRVRQRAEEVEDRANRELAADGNDVAGRLMVGGREHEPEADVLDAPRDGGRRQVDPRAERLEQVGRAGQSGGGAVAVLGDRAAGAGRDQRRRRRDVERPSPSTGAGGVEQVALPDRDTG